MYSLIYFFSKSLLILFGIIVIVISKKIPIKLILPNLSKYEILDKSSYLKYVRERICLMGIIYVILGLFSMINVNIYFLIIFTPSILILIMSKELKKFYKKI